ncbi:DnaB-like helicase C-terminal domain-containing protein [Streptomyces rimosus]|uniref:DnaB-like helicase C-terminal domain-containing protein n=1 Tax=Streptomyces rimosus TaxID=1927 RepID=UPI0005181004|nr:DnaB-like helicase C-terminal domain-containing protein [Streptomyces rimosus]
MAHVEHKLISKIITSGDLRSAIAAGIKPRHFHDPDRRSVYASLLAYQQEYGCAPTADVLRKDYPTFKLLDVEEPLAYFIDSIRETKKRALTEKGLTLAAETWEEGDTEEALRLVREMLQTIADDVPSGVDYDLAQTGDERLERYQQYAELDGELRGLPTGFDSLDKATGGLQPGQLIVLTGLAKSGKTQLALTVAQHINSLGYTVLVFSFEMVASELSERVDAIAAKVSLTKLRSGELDKLEFKRLEKAIRKMEEAATPFVISEDVKATTTLGSIQAKIDEVKPDVVLIDGIYFLRDEITGEKMTNAALTNISRGSKQLARACAIPVIVTTQSLRSKLGAGGLAAGSVGYTSAFEQDCDGLFGVEATDVPKESKLKIMASRNCPTDEFLLVWDYETSTFQEAKVDFGYGQGDDDAADDEWFDRRAA